jgi:hypothetical protein
VAKRVSLSERRASDARGVDVIFGGAPETEGTAPLEELASRAEESNASASGASQLPVKASTTAQATLPEDASAKEAPPKPVLSKVTVYIRPEQVIAIESIQLAQRQRTGKKPDKSDLLQEAVDLLVAKYQG